MIEQVSNSLMFLAHFTVSSVAGTGLTITCTIYKASDGSTVVSAQAATEIGGGLYKYELASGSVGTADEYVAVFNEAAATADQQDIPALWVVGRAGVENLDAAASSLATAAALATHDGKLDTVDTNVDAILADTAAMQPLVDVAISTRAASGTITVSAPVDASTNALTITRGDDYLEAEGRELGFSSADWPDLTGATAIVLSLRKRAANTGRGSTLWATVAHRAAGLVVGSGTQTVEFEPDATDTADLEPGGAAGIYDVQATLASGSIVTLVTGSITVIEDQTRA